MCISIHRADDWMTFFNHFRGRGHQYDRLFIENDAIMLKHLDKCENHFGRWFAYEDRPRIGFTKAFENMDDLTENVRGEINA